MEHVDIIRILREFQYVEMPPSTSLLQRSLLPRFHLRLPGEVQTSGEDSSDDGTLSFRHWERYDLLVQSHERQSWPRPVEDVLEQVLYVLAGGDERWIQGFEEGVGVEVACAVENNVDVGFDALVRESKLSAFWDELDDLWLLEFRRRLIWLKEGFGLLRLYQWKLAGGCYLRRNVDAGSAVPDDHYFLAGERLGMAVEFGVQDRSRIGLVPGLDARHVGYVWDTEVATRYYDCVKIPVLGLILYFWSDGLSLD